VKYIITHKTVYAYSEAVPVCHNLVHLAPRPLPNQLCEEFRLLVHPEPFDISHRFDYFGNKVSHFSINQPHLGLTVTGRSRITVEDPVRPAAKETPPWEEVANWLRSDLSPGTLEACQFRFDSPGIKPFAGLGEYAKVSFPPGRPILEGVMELTRRIHKEFRYDPRATTIQTPIQEVFEQRHGVCQDFAHLQIGCLRSLGLAARYVSGYLRTEPPPGKPRLVGADASHAWLSVYCGAAAGWIDVDPTNDLLVKADHVSVAWGRDYHDVCPVQGTIVGGGDHKVNVSVDVAPQPS